MFEIACYKNKVSNWRAGIETDLDEVLQTTAVFNNVSKGIMAKEKQLQDAFGTTDEKTICLDILDKGELQVSDKERKLQYDNLYKDVASIIAEKCIDPNTNRQYTATIIERALKDVHFNPDLKKSAKQQAFSEALPLLQERFSIQRANMRVQLQAPVSQKASVRNMIETQKFELERMHVDNDAEVVVFVCLIEPGMYRTLHKVLEDATHGNGRIELLNLAASGESQAATTAVRSVKRADDLPDDDLSMQSSLPQTRMRSGTAEEKRVVYERGAIAGLPDDFARKDMFLEIDRLEKGWEVELTQNHGSDIIQAAFYAPTGEAVGPFAKARRQALASNKARHQSKEQQT